MVLGPCLVGEPVERVVLGVLEEVMAIPLHVLKKKVGVPNRTSVTARQAFHGLQHTHKQNRPETPM